VIVGLTKKIFFGRFQKPWRWPESVPKDDWERVRFANRGGAQLAAVFGAARRDAIGAIVLAHPMGLAAKGFWLKQGHATILRDAGFHVLAFDFNGFGESESSDFDFPGDVVAAGEYLRSRTASLPVSVAGCSFGAGYALCALANEGHPFRAAVLESAWPSLPFYWHPYKIPYFFLRASQFVYPRFERELRPELAATKIQHNPRLLLIHGEADTITPPFVGDDLRKAVGNRASVDLWRVPGADHNLALRAQTVEYVKRVTTFLSDRPT
jgi:uncharacterized protein